MKDPELRPEKAEHTPGPWDLEVPFGEERDTVTGDPNVYVSASANTGLIAKVLNPGEYPNMILGAEQQQQANARFIAAAPSLYEAALNVIWKLNRNEADSPEAPGYPAKIDRRDVVIRQLQAAIDRARGVDNEDPR